MIVGAVIPEGDLAGGSSLIMMEERIEGGSIGLRGKGLGKGVRTCGDLIGGWMIDDAGGECTG